MIRKILLSATSVLLTVSCHAEGDQPHEGPGQTTSYEVVFAGLAMDCIHKEYSNKIAHYMTSDADLKPPRELYPVFYGCFDWHSSVHGHWLLVRMLNTSPDKVDRKAIISKLNQSFTADNVAGELRSYGREGMKSFERPYGIAWLLQLTAELRQASFPEAKTWLDHLLPLESLAVANMSDWLPKLAHPIRTGEHSQTAFAFGLMLDWSRIAGDTAFESLLTTRINALYGADRDCPLNYEPSGQDFLSPCLAEADLMRRVMNKRKYAGWLTEFFPDLTSQTQSAWLDPATVTDKTDGKLAHLDGLNTSRAWMLKGIISGLPESDERVAVLRQVADKHEAVGLDAVLEDMHYMGSHWLGSFAAYLVTERGLSR